MNIDNFKIEEEDIREMHTKRLLQIAAECDMLFDRVWFELKYRKRKQKDKD